MAMVMVIMVMVIMIIIMIMVVVVMAGISTSLDRFFHNGLEEVLSIPQPFCVTIGCSVILLFLNCYPASSRGPLETRFVNLVNVLKEGFDGSSFDESNFCSGSISRSMSDHCLGILWIWATEDERYQKKSKSLP